jgi:hypothetical protein
MAGRFLHTDAGFILEGEVRSVEGSLCDALRELEGQQVRITVEVVERGPVDALREAVERFRQDLEDPQLET